MPNADITSVVERLVNAENARNADAARAELAADFSAITRGRGVEQDRDAMLKELANPPNPALQRRLEPDPWIRQSGDLAVVRSVVEVIDPTATPPTTRFRNTHVLSRAGGAWTCVAWQVTKLA
jgi:hypothetical protein